MIVIYALECTDGVYVGCTAGKLNKRLREHRCLLNAGVHKATGLQKAWEKDPTSFRIRAVDLLVDDAPIIMKRERELFWMKHYRDNNVLLNDFVISFSPPDGSSAKAAKQRVLNGNKNITPEGNLKRRLAQLGIPKGHGAKISATKQANKLLMR